MAKYGKGSAFEREICKKLSLWWSGGKSDAVFWRTSNSGGRATVRGKMGKKTKGQHGDICAIDPVGQPFLDLFTVELKRGYSSNTLQDLIDKPKGAAVQVWERWIEKAKRDAEAAGSRSWCIITRRDKRDALILMPIEIYEVYMQFCDVHQIRIHLSEITYVALSFDFFLFESQQFLCP